MNKLLIFILIIFLTLNISGCINQPDNKIRNEIIIGIGQDIFGFNPWIEVFDVDTLSVNKNIFNCLVGVDESFRIVPELAESWINPDNLTWRFFLREGVNFHNGNNFSAEDVEYTIDLIRSNESNVLNELLINIDEVIVIDNFTVDIKTVKPCPILLNKLIDIMIVSKDYQQTTSKRWPVGTGAYKFVNHVENDYVRLERFDGYWKGLSDIKKVRFKVIEESESRKNALINKTIDIGSTIYPEYYSEISIIEGIEVKVTDTPTVYYLSFDFRENDSSFLDDKNPFSDVRVRKAIYHSINIDEIIDKYFYGFATSISHFVSHLIFGYNPDIERLAFDLDAAKKFLEDAGYEGGFQTTLDCPEENIMKNVSKEIIEQLLKINISVDLNALPLNDYYNKVFSRNTSFYIIGWLPGIEGGEMFDYLLRSVDDNRSIGTYNAGYYSNSEVDELGEKISWTMDPVERQRLIQQGFTIAMQDVAWIPLFSIQWIYGSSDDLSWKPRPDLNIRVEDISLKNL